MLNIKCLILWFNNKNEMKKILLVITMFALIGMSANALTNVSGGIYSNTTWTLNNSPYIVIDNVVVFPGVTLTIEAGVVVKFDSTKGLEIRQAALYAIGTSTDSITFTSNSSTPSIGIWGGIYCHGTSPFIRTFNYCNFNYAGTAILNMNYDTLIVKNSKFINNNIGINNEALTSTAIIDTSIFFNNINIGIKTFNTVLHNCYISNSQIGIWTYSNIQSIHAYNCIIINNQRGIDGDADGASYFYAHNCIIDSNSVYGIIDGWWSDSLINCEIKYNPIGIWDSGGTGPIAIESDIENNNIGIQLQGSYGIFNCNTICNNPGWNVKYVNASFNMNMLNNYWCSTDSVFIESKIYDGYDNISLGIIHVFPCDSVNCNLLTGINTIITPSISQFSLYPNPTSGTFTLTYNSQLSILHSQFKIYDVTGREVYSQPIINQESTIINVSNLSNGIYFYQLINKEETYRGKFVKE
jgi:hypothetical protein